MSSAAAASPAPPSAGVFYGREHQLAVRIYYEDTDFTSRVYHASYVRFLERGRSDFLRLAGADHGAVGALGVAFAVVRLEVRFQRGARIDDALIVATTLGALRGARLGFAQQILRGDEPICVAEVEVACIDAAGRPRRPPRPLVRLLSAHALES